MVPSEVIERVRSIQFRDACGTAFLYERHGRQYLITARHIVEGISAEDTVEILFGNEWLKQKIRLVGHSDLDVSVICTPEPKYFPAEDWVCADNTYAYGQDVYFLGFPYGFYGDIREMLSGYPLPFIRKAIVSSFGHGRGITYLDGFNNPGFSGGPGVVKIGPNRFGISFIISGFVGQEDEIIVEGLQNPLTVTSNSGLIVALPIGIAHELIDAHPIGPHIPTPRGAIS